MMGTLVLKRLNKVHDLILGLGSTSSNDLLMFLKNIVILSLEYAVPCQHSPISCVLLGVYNKTNVPCHFLFNIEIIHPQ